jgi:outer membrane protein assembly factor BamB
MRRATSLIGVLLGCTVLMSAAYVSAQDWPQWRGPNRDGKVAGFTAPETWPKELAQKWKVTVGAGDSTPALVGDKLYVHTRQGENEVIQCLSAADGKQGWENKYPAPAVSGPSAREHAGPRSSPAVADGKVVTLGATGIVSCVDAADGKTLWRNDEYKGVPRFYTASSPLIVDGIAVLQLGGSKDGAIVAFDLASGKPKWKWTGEGPDYASPMLMTVEGVKQIVAMTDKGAVGLAVADGKLLWQVPFAPSGMNYNAATPIVDGQTVIITGQGRGTKALKIEKQGDAFAAKELWSSAPLAPQFNTPVLKDGLLFGLSAKNNFYCINAKDGKTAWSDTTAHGSRGFGSILDAGSVMLALPNNGELIVYKPSDTKYEELAKIKVSGTATYAHPVVSGKRIFVKDQDALTLWTVE